MNIKLVYHSSTGNTEKLALSIAKELECNIKKIEKEVPNIKNVDLLVLGDGIYMGKFHKKTLEFIDNLDPQNIKNIALFATYGSQRKAVSNMYDLLKKKGFRIIGEPFMCKGKAWGIFNYKYPTKQNIKDAVVFAKKIKQELK